MITNNSVTFWHYDEESGEYIRTNFTPVWAAGKKSSKSEKGGEILCNPTVIRVPTTYNLGNRLFVGDYVRLGIHDDEPMRSCDMKITEISDNRRGLSPHWRIGCE